MEASDCQNLQWYTHPNTRRRTRPFTEDIDQLFVSSATGHVVREREVRGSPVENDVKLHQWLRIGRLNYSNPPAQFVEQTQEGQ